MTRWICELLLGCFFITVGAMKAFQYGRVLPAMPWLGDVPRGLVFVIGYSELLGGAGLILPGIAGVSLLVFSFAAFGLAVVVIYIVAFNATAAKVIEYCQQPPLLPRRRA